MPENKKAEKTEEVQLPFPVLTVNALPELYKKLEACTVELQERAILGDGNYDKTILEVTEAAVTKKGYDTTGFRYQRLVDVMNSVFGSHNWRIVDTLIPDHGYFAGNNGLHNVALRVEVQIGNWRETADGNSVFVVLDSKACYGHSASRNVGDAYKGAMTNGFKKAVSLMGLGSTAYTGELHTIIGAVVPISDDEEDYDLTPDPTYRGELKSAPSPDGNDDYNYPRKCVVTGEDLDEKQYNYFKERFKWGNNKLRLKPMSYKAFVQMKSEKRLQEFVHGS